MPACACAFAHECTIDIRCPVTLAILSDYCIRVHVRLYLQQTTVTKQHWVTMATSSSPTLVNPRTSTIMPRPTTTTKHTLRTQLRWRSTRRVGFGFATSCSLPSRYSWLFKMEWPLPSFAWPGVTLLTLSPRGITPHMRQTPAWFGLMVQNTSILTSTRQEMEPYSR